MQRYFFTLNFPMSNLIDPDGAEAPDLATAEREAREAIREIATEYIVEGKPLTLRGITICDERGVGLAEVTTKEALDEIMAPIGLSPYSH